MNNRHLTIMMISRLLMDNDDFVQYVDYQLSCYNHFMLSGNVMLPQRLLVQIAVTYLRGV